MATLAIDGLREDAPVQWSATENQTNRFGLDVFNKDDLSVQITVVDSNGDAVDISGYTTRSFSVETRDGTAVDSGTPAFDTDGTDGLMSFTIDSADWARALRGR